MGNDVEVRLCGRRTGMGAYTEITLFFSDGSDIVCPFRRESSKTGNHWEDIYYLPPGEYIASVMDITNSGKHHCGFKKLVVDQGGWQFMPIEKIPPNILPPCPCLTPEDC